MFNIYYEKYLGYNTNNENNKYSLCRTDMRDIPLNKRYIYRIIITKYKNRTVVSSSPMIKDNVIEAIGKYIKDYNIEDVIKCPTLIDTGLRLSKMYRMILKQKTSCIDQDSNVYYNDNLKKYYIKERNEIVSYCKISDVFSGFGNIVVWTNESYRRNGLARKLLLLTINKCQEEGIYPIYLVNSQNTPSLALAKSVGFDITQTEIVACEEIDI